MSWLGAVQAQDYHGAKWGLALRTQGATSASIDQLFNDGRILRTHVLRPTWHFVLPRDIRWLLALTSPRVHAANAAYYRKFELDGPVFARSQHLIVGALERGQHCTRAELAAALSAGGLPMTGQRLAYALMRAELDAVICSGPLRGRQFTYALLDERVPLTPALDREAALTELALRYFTSHGPASVHDFAWWSGLTVKEARAGLHTVESRLGHESSGHTDWWLAARPAVPAGGPVTIDLLPNYDEHIVAYKDHEPTLDPGLPARKPGDDTLAAHLIVRDGLVTGGWRRTLKARRVEIRAKLLVALRREERAMMQAAADAYGGFLGLTAILTG